jgi:hypothetical protein
MPHLIRTNRQFPNRSQIGSLYEDLVVAASSPIGPVTADQVVALPDPLNPGQFLQYGFLFWNVGGAVSTGLTATGTMPAGDSVLTAWYAAIGGGGGGAGVTTYAFSVGQDVVVADTPIAAVTPAAAWAGGNATAVSTTAAAGPVTISARNAVPGAPGESFDEWFQYGTGTPAGIQLTVPNGGASLAIASYAVPEILDFRIPRDLIEELGDLFDRIKPQGDPSPGDLVRLAGRVARSGPRELEADELTRALSQIDRLDAGQLQNALLEIQTRMKRLDAATVVLKAALKEAGPK